MKHTIKRILIFMLIFILGTISGVAGTAWLGKVSQGIQTGMEFITLSYLSFELDEATNQYLYSTNIDISIYALEHLIKFNEDFYNRYILTPETKKNSKVIKFFDRSLPFDSAVAYVRLGNLYEKKGEQEKAAQCFRKGLKIMLTQKLFEGWKGTKKEIKTVEDIRRLVAELDDRLREQKLDAD